MGFSSTVVAWRWSCSAPGAPRTAWPARAEAVSGAVVLWDGTVDLTARMTWGVPTWRWRAAPRRLSLATRRQLRAQGLRPGGQAPVARIECRRGRRFAWLYRVDLARPVRPMTPARWRALDRAMAARRWCPQCQRYGPGCISTRYGCCLDCLSEKEANSSPAVAG